MAQPPFPASAYPAQKLLLNESAILPMNIGEVDDIDSALSLDFVFKFELKSLLEIFVISFSFLHISLTLSLCSVLRIALLLLCTVLF